MIHALTYISWCLLMCPSLSSLSSPHSHRSRKWWFCSVPITVRSNSSWIWANKWVSWWIVIWLSMSALTCLRPHRYSIFAPYSTNNTVHLCMFMLFICVVNKQCTLWHFILKLLICTDGAVVKRPCLRTQGSWVRAIWCGHMFVDMSKWDHYDLK